MQSSARRNFILGLAAAGAASASRSVLAQAPRMQAQRPAAVPLDAGGRLRIVIPAAEGGGWDQTGRQLGNALMAANTFTQIDYENIGGKGGTIGLAHYVQTYSADPNTLLIGGMVMVGALALQKPQVDLSRVAPLARLTSDYEIIAVRQDSPMQTAKDLIGLLRSDPARARIAGGSAGGVDHMFAGLLARAAGNASSLAYQPFPGGAQVVAAVESGDAVAGISGYSEFSEHLASGRLRAIGTSSKTPFQGIPAVRQQGVDVDLANWRGVFTGKAVPLERQRALLDAVRRANATDGWQRAIKRSNWDPFWMEGNDFKGFLELDVAMASLLVYLLKLRA